MPAISQKMYRAMQAAKHGNSTLGIPQSVGAEFVAATPEPSALPESAHSDAEAHREHCKACEAKHRKMARKAGSPAARQLHKKLQAHYANQLK